jgi:hypothetical protein
LYRSASIAEVSALNQRAAAFPKASMERCCLLNTRIYLNSDDRKMERVSKGEEPEGSCL